MSFRYTAANLSKIRKPAIRKILKTPLKREKKPVKKDAVERLEVLDPSIQLDFHLSASSSVREAVKIILENQWAEQTRFHQRYYSAESTSSDSALHLLVLRGISMEKKAEILQYRALQLPSGGLVTVNQLYTVFEFRGNTFVDRSLELSFRTSKIRKFIISNTLPVILKTGIIGLGHKVTFGFENTEVVVLSEQYEAEIYRIQHLLIDKEEKQTLQLYVEYLRNNPTALTLTNVDFNESQFSTLIRNGLATLTSNHHNEIDVTQYAIAYPRCGVFLKMINSGRLWIVKTLKKCKNLEILENLLFDKWEGKQMANFRSPFYGYDLLWILADSKGSGVVEAFSTPVGRAWRLTGKL